MAYAGQSSSHDLPVIEAALEKIMQKSRKGAGLLAVLRPIMDRAVSQIIEQHGVFLAGLKING